jgi:histidyl-tRNA synthetase
MKAIIKPVKGTRDFYPERMAVRKWLYATVRLVSESFGYLEYEGPLIESLELYASKSGDELVKEQSFVFEDRGGNLITLRPELTPTLARMIAQRQNQLAFPVRWWSFGPFWRYERPQKGRTREFFQWNIDLIGADSPAADAELIAIAVAFFQKIGLQPSNIQILVNNRQLMEAELSALSIPPGQLQQVFRLVDRLDKMKRSDWESYAREIGLTDPQIVGLSKLLEDDQLWKKSDALCDLFQALDVMGVKEYVRFAPNVIRGLDYYTGTVFEAQAITGDLRRAILGGGRYDNLLVDVGGDPVPAVGFAMGDVVIMLVLEDLGFIPSSVPISPAQVLVTVFDVEYQLASLSLASEIRKTGINVACYPQADKLSRQLKYADRAGFRFIAILGPDEKSTGQVTLKDLRSGTQQSVASEQCASLLKRLLESAPSS